MAPGMISHPVGYPRASCWVGLIKCHMAGLRRSRSRMASFSRMGDGGLRRPDDLARMPGKWLLHQAVDHKAVGWAIDVKIEPVGKIVIVIDGQQVRSNQCAVLELARALTHGADRLLLHSFGLDDAGRTYRNPDGSILLEYPIEQVIIVSGDRSGAQHQLTAGAAADHIPFEVPPCRAVAGMFEEACQLRLQNRSARIRRHQAGKVLRMGRAIVGANGLNQAAKKKLSGVDKGAGVPAFVGIHVGHIHL